jgi:hypothetical protein
MAQASSVPAREPSMEEILASIRRIIEDSDHASPAGNDAQPQASAQPAEADNTAPEPAPEADFGPNFSANDAGAADLDAFRSELGRADPLPREPDEPQVEQRAEPPVSFDASGTQIGLDKPVEPPLEPVEEAAPPTISAEPPAPEPEPAQPEPAASNLPQRTSIISETAERQVAAAFGELSDVFAASQKRSFDEIAEELMRPMLQDWLDNNLPVLVERLVREEIERVARGATR